MSFCAKCGAYIPMEETACPACGFDPETEAREAALRQQQEREQQRLREQEQARQQAEDALRREQQEKKLREQEERQRADAERARRARETRAEQTERLKREQQARQEQYRQTGAQYGANRGSYTGYKTTGSAGSYKTAESPAGAGTGSYSSSGKTKKEPWVAPWEGDSENKSGYDPGYDRYRAQAADSVRNQSLSVFSYLGPLFLIPLLTRPKEDRFARFHANQGLNLLIFGAVTSLLGEIPVVGQLIELVGIIFSVYCMVEGIRGVCSGRMDRLPLIGGFDLIK